MLSTQLYTSCIIIYLFILLVCAFFPGTVPETFKPNALFKFLCLLMVNVSKPLPQFLLCTVSYSI